MEKQKEAMKRLEAYKQVDVKLDFVQVTPKGEVTLRQDRALKGLRTYDAQVDYVARNEISMFAAEKRNEGFVENGYKEFRWITRDDARVRETHSKLHNKIFSFDNPPIIDGRPLLPGEDYNCRCEARALKKDIKKAA